MLFKDYVRSGIWAGLMLLLFVSSAAQAESACKGLASSQCSGKSDCVWVGGYTRKDNRKVSGYCRAKGGKGATTGKSAKKTTSSKNREVTGKQSAKKSAGKKTKKEKTTTKKKSAEKPKSDSSKAKTKEKKKTKKAKTAN